MLLRLSARAAKDSPNVAALHVTAALGANAGPMIIDPDDVNSGFLPSIPFEMALKIERDADKTGPCLPHHSPRTSADMDTASSNIHPTKEVEIAGMSMPGDDDIYPERAKNPLAFDQDVLDTVMGFVGDKNYLLVASVSTRWREIWGQRATVTSPRSAVQSCSCLDWAKACGLDIWHSPCFYAAAEGRLDVLEHAVALGYSREGMQLCEYAAGGGHLEVVRWCRSNGYPWGESSVRAAESGHLEVLRWCVANGCPMTFGRIKVSGACRSCALYSEGISMRIMNAAARGGQLETIQWCREQGYPWSSEECRLAASGGHFELLRWLRGKGCPWSPCTMDGAAEVDDIEMLEWCRTNGCPWSNGVYSKVAQRGNLEILRWCFANDQTRRMPKDLCANAAENGHLEVLKYLRENGCQWGRDVCSSAACGGHFEVLKWCVANGCPWDNVFSCSARVFQASIPMMVWANAKGCPWMHFKVDFDSICVRAATEGNLRFLQWCDTFYPLHSPMVSHVTASRGHVHILEWLRLSGKLSDEGTLEWLRGNKSLSDAGYDSSICIYVARAGLLEVMKWCRANGYPWGSEICREAAEFGNLKLLEWCRRNGCPWGKEPRHYFFEHGGFEMVAWCRANGCPWNFTSLHESAKELGNIELAEWCGACGCSAAREVREPRKAPSYCWTSLKRVL